MGKGKGMRRVLACALSFLWALGLAGACPIPCEAKDSIISDNPRVLFLSSYNYDWDSIPLQLKGITNTLNGRADIEYVFMNTKCRAYADIKEPVKEQILGMIEAEGSFEYVIVGDDDALEFAMEYREALFSGIPILFEGINNVEVAQKAARDPLVTGVIETFPLQETITMALCMNPKATRVVGISDETISGEGSTEQFLQCAKAFPQQQFQILDCSKLTCEQIGEEVSQYGKDTILVFLLMTSDGEGNHYSNAEAAEYLAQNARVPIYKADELGVGQGLLGGVVVSYEKMAAAAAEMVLQMEQGAPASALPITTAASYCLMDKNVMNRFNISKADVCRQAVYINDPPSFWEEHAVILVPAGIIIAALILQILIWQHNERKKRMLLKEIQEKDVMLNNLLENMPGGVAIYKFYGQGKYETLYTSKGVPKLSGRTSAEYQAWVDSGKLETMVYAEDIPPLKAAYMQSASKGAPINITYRIYHKNGSLVWITMSAVYIREEDGNKIYYAVFTDVSPQMLMRQKEQEAKNAEAANEAKTTFLSTVSHDMRTPLNGILGLTQLMMGKATDESIRCDLQQLQNSGQYLLNLINDTLDVSKIESGKFELHPAVCDGKSTVSNILSLLTPNLQQKKIKLRLHLEDLPYSQLYIDVGRTEQVVINIIGNAIKFTPEGGTIDFYMHNLSMQDGIITDEITVKDNGIGISAEFLPHLFEPFSRENSDSCTKYGGTGLGMTITQQIITQMGGTISVKSELGKGTAITFTLKMPLATPEQISAHEITQATAGRSLSLKGKRVLLCEDHPLNANIATRILEMQGVTVEHAENGKRGVEMFSAAPEGRFDAILMDIRMPEMDGIAATKAIRRLARVDAARIPIIAMTANAFDSDKKQALDAGMNAHLSKPIIPAELYSTLAEQIGRAASLNSEPKAQ